VEKPGSKNPSKGGEGQKKNKNPPQKEERGPKNANVGGELKRINCWQTGTGTHPKNDKKGDKSAQTTVLEEGKKKKVWAKKNGGSRVKKKKSGPVQKDWGGYQGGVGQKEKSKKGGPKKKDSRGQIKPSARRLTKKI